jgi:peptide/nickel transport system substrate-binding protein
MMPSHVIADLLGVDVTTALENNDATVVARIADAWNTLWDLKPGVNLRWFPSSGPYKLDSVRSDGAVVLVVNDRWWATKPITKRVIVYPRAADVPQRLKDGSADVVDIASGLVGGLTVPNGYERVDTASGGIQQLILSDEGALAAPAARRALALCTPRDVIARDAGVPIAKAALNGTPLTVRIGYQAPNARLGGAVKAIATACAPAGITVQDAATDHTGPQSIKNKEIEVLLASTGGAVGSGSSASSSIDAYALHTANGNNLSGYSNPQVDGIIDNLAITSDAKEIARLLGDSAGVLWNDMPTLPLYRQQRTVISSKNMEAVTPNPTRWGAGWNMDRWALRE